MSSLTANQRRFLTALTLSTIAVLAYLLALVPGAASADDTPSRATPHVLEIHVEVVADR